MLGSGAAGWWFSRAPAGVHVWFADVGQGDGIIIRTPSQQTIVVDGGPRANFPQEVDDHVPVTDRTIDLLVVTHGDADHVTGLVPLVASGRVRAVLMHRDTSVTTKVYQRLLEAIDAQDVPVIAARAGQVLRFGDVRVHVLWPPAAGSATMKTTNERSIVVKVSYGNADLLLTGDAPSTVETLLVEQWGSLLDVEVLKVGHHGSSHSTARTFLDATSPGIAVLSVGAENRYGHPGARVLDDLAAVRAGVFRTDERGDVHVSCAVDACAVE